MTNLSEKHPHKPIDPVLCTFTSPVNCSGHRTYITSSELWIVAPLWHSLDYQ